MTPAQCRVCHSTAAKVAGVVEYLAGFRCTIVDCDDCGCRTSADAPAVHADLHVNPAISYYATYRSLFDECRTLFAAGDRPGIERLLRQHRKYAFVLDRLAALGDGASVLEWGCSRGYLTAAALLSGKRVLGVDVAAAAVAAARDAFGDHFATDDSPRIEASAPFDAIWHVGVIGCVPDPLGLTRRLLSLLKPGGTLFFNAPNRDALHQRSQLWLDSAPPPEVITLFPHDFWRNQMAGAAVSEVAEPVSAAESTVKTLRHRFGPRWRPPSPRSLGVGDAYRWQQPRPNVAWRSLEAVAAKLSAMSGIGFGSWPEEFGLYVAITKP
jgi:SAM-dependent methyltransferase